MMCREILHCPSPLPVFVVHVPGHETRASPFPPDPALTERILRSETGCRCGESHYKAKLSDAQVRQIRDLYEFEGYSAMRIALRFGVSFNTIRKIVFYVRRNTLPDWNRVR